MAFDKVKVMVSRLDKEELVESSLECALLPVEVSCVSAADNALHQTFEGRFRASDSFRV